MQLDEKSGIVILSDEELAAVADDSKALPNPYLDPDWDHLQSVLTTADEDFLKSVERMDTSVVRDTPATLSWLHGQHDHPSQSWYRLCLALVHDARNIRAWEPTAYQAWLHAKHRTNLVVGSINWGRLPRGCPLFYKGANPEGHVATYIGVTQVGPLCWTNDAIEAGKVNLVSPLWFISHWGHNLLGWSHDINGVWIPLTVPQPPPPPQKPHVSLTALQTAAVRARHGEGTPTSVDDVKAAKHFLDRMNYLAPDFVDGFWGPRANHGWAQWQYLLGYRGSDADGMPGWVSLTRAADKFGDFVAVA